MTKSPIAKNNLNSDQSERMGFIWSKIQDFQKLEHGWDYGEGEVISKDVAKRAIAIAEYGLISGLNANVRPSSEGELIITLFRKDRFLFIDVKPEGTYNTTYEKGIGVDYEIIEHKENLELSSLFKYITKWALSELFTFKNMTLMHIDSEVMPLRNIEMEKFPSSMNNVLRLPVMVLYADTFSNTTKQQSATRFSFAELM